MGGRGGEEEEKEGSKIIPRLRKVIKITHGMEEEEEER